MENKLLLKIKINDITWEEKEKQDERIKYVNGKKGENNADDTN